MANSQSLNEQRELLQLQKQQLEARNDLSESEKGILENLKKQISELNKLIQAESRRKKLIEDTNDEFKSFASEFKKLSPSVKKQLGDVSAMSGVYAQLSTRSAREAAIAKNNNGIVKQNAEIRKSALDSALESLTQQASEAAKAQDELLGITQFERERLDLESRRKELGNANVDTLIAASKQTELLSKKTEILQNMNESLPEPITKMIGFAKQFRTAILAGAGPLFLIGGILGAAVVSFTKLDEASKEFRETTGFTNSQMTGIKSDTNEIVGQFGYLGIEAKNVFDTVAGLKSEFSDVADFSKETISALTVLSANFGVSAENAAKVQSILEQVGGLSSETAASVQLQVVNMAKLAGVAPAKVMADIAESAEIASTIFKGDTIALAKNAIEARRLGTNLKSVAATAEKLLDFESGIEEELVAATFVGGQFNLSRARALAFEGKIVDAQKEVLAQVQRTGDFRQKDYFTQQQLAKAAGMSVEEINKQLNAQEKLSKLSTEERAKAEKAIEQGLDITNINAEQLAQETEKFSTQQEQQAALEQLQNSFNGIALTIGSVLTPLLEGLIPIMQAVFTPISWAASLFQMIVDNGYALIPIAAALAISFGKMAVQSGIAAFNTMRTAIASIFAGNAKLGPVGLITAGVGVAALIALLSKASNASPAGDMISPAGGKTMVSTKEGGLFELSSNDDLIAAPGLASKVGGGNISILSAPLNAMLNEMKALRNDLNSGKVAVYMDTSKVTSNISKKVDETTRNSFNLGLV